MKENEVITKVTLGQFIRALLEYYNTNEASWISGAKMNSNNDIVITLTDVQDKTENVIEVKAH